MSAHKHLTKGQITRIKALYIAGMTPRQIIDATSISITPVGIYKLAKRLNLNDARTEFAEKSNAKIQDSILEKTNKAFEENLQDLQTIKDVSISAILSENVKPEKFSEASKAYIDSMDMERKIRIEGLQLSFITEIAKILREEIKDEAVLIRLGERFRTVFELYQKQSLNSGKT